jgi:hypothetical protein
MDPSLIVSRMTGHLDLADTVARRGRRHDGHKVRFAVVKIGRVSNPRLHQSETLSMMVQ